jgi:hypothetical protein
MRYSACLLVIILFSSTVIATRPHSPSPQQQGESFSFENDMEGWTPEATDLELGDGFINWSITRSQDSAADGVTSLKFFLANGNDAGKIWIERPFAVEPGRTYQVGVEYAFASPEFRDVVNPFTLITGVLVSRPKDREDLRSTFQGPTYNDSESDVGLMWVKKKYEFTARADENGVLYVLIGIWGTWETARTYYFDNVRITLTGAREGVESPAISSVVKSGKTLKIKGANFGDAPRVLINNVDRSDFIKSSSGTTIKLKGKASQLGLNQSWPGDINRIQVVNDAAAAASNVFIFELRPGL